MLNLGPDMGNSGIEGVAYRAADRTAFAVKETSPSRMYRIVLDSAGNPAQSFPDQPFDIGNKSGDAADLAALDDGNFILVNQEQDRLEGFDPQGKPLSNVTLGMSKPEGIAYDAATGTIYVVGEPREFAVFRPGPGVVGLARATAGSLAMSVGRGGAGTGPVLNLLLERSGFVTVSLSTLDGGRMGVFQGRLGPGPHALSLGRLPMGFGICRVLAGSESRSLKLMPD